MVDRILQCYHSNDKYKENPILTEKTFFKLDKKKCGAMCATLSSIGLLLCIYLYLSAG